MKILKLLIGLSAILCCTTMQSQQLEAVPGDRRPTDRDAIRTHIDSIFRAYMQSDRAKIEATHARDWRGFLRSSRTIVRGLDEYMEYAERDLKGPLLPSYKILDFDVMFYGDVALVPYIAQLGPEDYHYKLRVLDVYAKLQGNWIQVGSYTAPHPDTDQYYREQVIELPAQDKQKLLAAREAVWRDYFANNKPHLEQTLPTETIAINPGEKTWEGREQILAGAKEFADAGAKLTRLEFPKTEIQAYGNVALLYSEYVYQTEMKGKTEQHSGRATEMFVNRDGKWVNVGWHLDAQP
jgi:ketosteroid isomerase-like protein